LCLNCLQIAFGCEKVSLDVTDETSIEKAVAEIYGKAGHVGELFGCYEADFMSD
jgi:hypothetical protein